MGIERSALPGISQPYGILRGAAGLLGSQARGGSVGAPEFGAFFQWAHLGRGDGRSPAKPRGLVLGRAIAGGFLAVCLGWTRADCRPPPGDGAIRGLGVVVFRARGEVPLRTAACCSARCRRGECSHPTPFVGGGVPVVWMDSSGSMGSGRRRSPPFGRVRCRVDFSDHPIFGSLWMGAFRRAAPADRFPDHPGPQPP